MDDIAITVPGEIREVAGQALLGPVRKAAEEQAFLERDREMAVAAGKFRPGGLFEEFCEAPETADARRFSAVRVLLDLSYRLGGVGEFTAAEGHLRSTWRAFVRDAREALEEVSRRTAAPAAEPSSGTCQMCRHFSWFYPPDDDGDEGRGLCGIPPERLPLSMAGVAMREKESVSPFATGCPMFELAGPDA